MSCASGTESPPVEPIVSFSTINETSPAYLGVPKIYAGGLYSCALFPSGKVACWGDNQYGQLGNGTAISTKDQAASFGTPVHLGGKAIKLATGHYHACALMDDATVRCWGYGKWGHLGYGNKRSIGDNENVSDAGPVPIGEPVLDVFAGDHNTCVILAGGNVKCWGRNLAYGDAEIRGDDETPDSYGYMPFGEPVVTMALGEGSCAILQSGAVKCWGNGRNWQLGNGNTDIIGDDETLDTLPPVDLGGATASQIAISFQTACAVTDAGLFCWGSNGSGEAGQPFWVNNADNGYTIIGDDEAITAPGPVDYGGGTIVDIEMSSSNTCVLLDDKTVRCWGFSFFGQLGYGLGDYVAVGDDETPASVGPLPVGGAVTELSLGHLHAVAKLEDDTFRIWGSNSQGECGYASGRIYGDDEPASEAPLLDLDAGLAGVDVGTSSTCAVTPQGRVVCWGYSTHGKLGYGSSHWVGDDETPASAGYVNVGGQVKEVCTLSSNACALTVSGKVYCWGYGGFGIPGIGNTTTIGDNEHPASTGPIALGGVATALSCYNSTACAILEDGNARCWGYGRWYKLGHAHEDTIGDDETPDQYPAIDLAGMATKLAPGQYHTCALLSDGTVKCWGISHYGQTGYTQSTQQGPGANLEIGAPVIDIASGTDHTCVIIQGGAVRCFGRAKDGRLGYGNLEDIGDDETPASAGDVPLSDAAVAIAAGGAHTCAILAGGQVQCWGAGRYGRLGYGNESDIGDDEVPSSAGVVDLGGKAIRISTGDYSTCAVLEDLSVRCWGGWILGNMSDEEIGDDEPPSAAPPVALYDEDLDGVNDWFDRAVGDPSICSDIDIDSCDDCAVHDFVTPSEDGTDTDADGLCDLGDLDDDNDTVADALDIDPLDPTRCSDIDEDYCDDCANLPSIGQPPDPTNDGLDSDGDGRCDEGDDADGDGIANGIDRNRYDKFVCGDADGDECDDCSVTGVFDVADDGFDQDGDGICDRTDDSDNDGMSDETEIILRLPLDDADADDDGVLDGLEVFPGNDTDEDGIINALDCDSDGDGLNDATELGYTALSPQLRFGPNATNPNSNCFIEDQDPNTRTNPLNRDSDGDTVPDGLEDTNHNGAVDAGETNPDAGGDFHIDAVDTEGDTIINLLDGGGDHDGDGMRNLEDTDSDGDSIPDVVEVGDPNNPVTSDNKGNPDFLDIDADDDGIADKWEAGANPLVPQDTDGSGIPDYRDLDSDDDQILDAVEAGVDFVLNPTGEPLDFDQDGLYDFQDTDSDNDGILDLHEGVLQAVGDLAAPRHNLDSDGDGVSDTEEAGDNDLLTAPVDTDNDGQPDIVDSDSDNDGVLDGVDNCRAIANSDQANPDGDEFGAACDSDEAAPAQSGGCHSSSKPLTWLMLLALLVLRRRSEV